MKEIKIIGGFVTQVDDEDYDFLMQWKWRVKFSGCQYYVLRGTRKNGKYRNIYMHKIILNISENSKIQGDHIDRNSLNNQRSNLRRATVSQNMINRIYKNKCGYRGVCYDKQRKKYITQIAINCKNRVAGKFNNPIDAAKLYDTLALKYHGEFAITNF